MKRTVLIGCCIFLLSMQLYSQTSQELDDQFKKEIEACWNEHKQMMGQLQQDLKNQEKQKKDHSVQKMLHAKVEHVERKEPTQELFVKKVNSETSSDKKVDKVTEVHVEKVCRSKALQRIYDEDL